MPRFATLVAVLVLAAPLGYAQDVELTRFVLESDDLEASPGDRIEVDWIVRNNGPDEINFGIGFYLSDDAAFSSDDLFLEGDAGDADPGQSDDGTEQMTLPSSVEAGCYFVLGFADNQNGIDETDETNNLIARPIAVDRTVTACANQTAGEEDAAAGLGLDALTPNPVSGRAVVHYRLGAAGPVALTVVDALGREVVRLADGPRSLGEHRADLDASALPSGIYVVRLVAGGRSVVRTLAVAR